ncbi:uncharacterized protein LOC106162080 [Lingula anatina]|uniref:Uncharacterized protein LOC106162080 n=1 Tax=Lingula anatina TaxID=7574 RepID=A0A1S3I8S1_LINAN|nr:uncharacterized protein LOC106162080 [Lingula anatina]|eukprot:XP_013394660.1 uncharacterized protein LOC106162080 [Lingula anatina]
MNIPVYFQVFFISAVVTMQKAKWPCGYDHQACSAQEYVQGSFAFPGDCRKYFVCAQNRDRRSYSWKALRCNRHFAFIVSHGYYRGSCMRGFRCSPVTCVTTTSTSTTTTTTTAATTKITTRQPRTSVTVTVRPSTTSRVTTTLESTAASAATTISESHSITSLLPDMPTAVPSGNETTPVLTSDDVRTSSAAIVAGVLTAFFIAVLTMFAVLWWKKREHVKKIFKCSTKRKGIAKSNPMHDRNTYQNPSEVIFSDLKLTEDQINEPSPRETTQQRHNTSAKDKNMAELTYQNIPLYHTALPVDKKNNSDQLHLKDNSLYGRGDDRRSSTDSRAVLLSDDSEGNIKGTYAQTYKARQGNEPVEMRENSLYLGGPESPIYHVPITPPTQGENGNNVYSYAYSHQNSALDRTRFKECGNGSEYEDLSREHVDGDVYYSRISEGMKYEKIGLADINETEPCYLELISYNTPTSK